jgi:uncharacterized Zn-binding protein involved in type VI secretion
MFDAARTTDRTVHGPPITGTGCRNVRIGNLNAWRVSDRSVCSMCTPAGTPHGPGMVLKGSFTVLMGSLPAARMSDMLIEPAGLPQNNPIIGGDSSVKIGDLPLGLMDPDVLKAFCRAWRKLLDDWDGLTPAQRKQRTKEMVDNALEQSGSPKLADITENAAASAQASFTPWENVINLPAGFFSGPKPAGKVGRSLIHEARHAEQTFNAARYVANSTPGGAGIVSRMNGGIHPSVAEAAARNPAGRNTPAGQHGRMDFKQNHGVDEYGRRWNNQLRQQQQDVYGRHGADSPEYRQALQDYYGLPNESDAENTADALGKICPAVH